MASLWSWRTERFRLKRTTEVVAGEPLTILKKRGEWFWVKAAHYSKEGWIRVEHVGGPVPENWLTRHRGDPYLIAIQLFRGAPYLWGGMTEKGIDCAGLVHMGYRYLGTLIPRDADEQEEFGEKIEWDEVEPGDLITYGEAGSPMEGGATHIAFALTNGKILHSVWKQDGSGSVRIELEPENLKKRRRYAVRIPWD